MTLGGVPITLGGDPRTLACPVEEGLLNPWHSLGLFCPGGGPKTLGGDPRTHTAGPAKVGALAKRAWRWMP